MTDISSMLESGKRLSHNRQCGTFNVAILNNLLSNVVTYFLIHMSPDYIPACILTSINISQTLFLRVGRHVTSVVVVEIPFVNYACVVAV